MNLWAMPNIIYTLALAITLCNAATVLLPSYPLAVKSPYLSTWVPGNQLNDAATAQPEFWAGQELTWTILARVNGATYSLFGDPAGDSHTKATTSGFNYTSTHTLIDLSAGEVNITLDFFSPVLPGTNESARQSLPYSYLTVNAENLSGGTLDIEILSAIDQSWTAQNGSANLNYTSTGNVDFFQFHNPNEILFTEVNDMATYGSIVFGVTTDSSVTASCNPESEVYNQFSTNGSLSGTTSCTGDDLAALAKSLGSVQNGGSSSVTFAVGFDRVQAINYLDDTQTGLYRSQWPTIQSALEYFLQDYASVQSDSIIFDNEIRSKAQSVSSQFGSQYADIIEASVRQTFGAIELTVPASDLSANPSVFLKEISSDGNVNTIDVIFQSWPVFITLNPTYIKYLFEPILSYLQSGRWPKPYAIHDIGAHYPNATGHDDGVEEDMPLFETSALFILLYAYQKSTNDTLWTSQYSSLLEGYGSYLAENSLYPASQLISVDAINARPNQTGLAIQSTIALNAATEITGNTTYSETASSFSQKIYNDALGLDGPTIANSTHFTYYYGQSSTWETLFAAYSDIILELNTYPATAWELQSAWYSTQIKELGLPFAGPVTDLDYTGSPLNWALSDWNVVAAGASSADVQQAVINTTHAFLTNGLNTVPFGTKYYVEGPDAGKWIANKARSTVGSNFALLALDQGTWGAYS